MMVVVPTIVLCLMETITSLFLLQLMVDPTKEIGWEIVDINGNIVLSASPGNDDGETNGAPYQSIDTCRLLYCKYDRFFR